MQPETQRPRPAANGSRPQSDAPDVQLDHTARGDLAACHRIWTRREIAQLGVSINTQHKLQRGLTVSARTRAKLAMLGAAARAQYQQRLARRREAGE